MEKRKVAIPQLKEMKKTGCKLKMVTAYDYSMASLVDKSEIEMILVGDSLGMVVLGYEGTVPVTMEDMIHHIRSVVKGAAHTLVVGDMPFMSYNISREEAIRNAGRLMKEGGADCVKLEGGQEMATIVRAIVDAGIPVMAHIGLTPQTASALGGFKVQGKDAARAAKLLADAQALEEAGAFAIVLECIPAQLARLITEKLSIPTIGIGAGPWCDGQVLVTHDMLGLFDRFVPKFVKQYANVGKVILEAFQAYAQEVNASTFPDMEHSFTMKEEELAKLE
ncbi:3-methyl-2-oxobutanoate hydroxymethyltransferase [Gelria sp. Kuro-4]|uniref:3-methyl-2-oxobutanoate hydroxymethyltransferase n=1 Tax=Gelria sp. Kuro-4 TaxID=2796927 RepID=UPI001BEE632A|nr:3-methyl-2-oxobutanoate hydroxymethyltransferase [Gelria sp. Kuro-4]BCV24868.1 3-methyl-2-oxobutanoate hydroxymethyltransferase [Gelria sp. Kuro-4]